MTLLIICIASAFLFVFGTPIVLVMAVWVSATSYWVVDYPLTNIGLSALDSLKSFAFLAVPLFIATGDFLTAGGMSQKLVGLSRSLSSWMPGRTAATTALASGLFSAVSGSNAATAATMAQIMGPEMKRLGINQGRAGAIIAAGGTLGVIIPPSTIFIIYGVTLGVSTVDLNLAGVLPGIVMMLFLIGWGGYLTRKEEPSLGLSGFSIRAILRDFLNAYLGLLAVGLLMFGLYFGWFSSTEAAGVAAIYCLLAGVLVTRQIKVREIPHILEMSAAITGIIAPMVVFSLQFQQILSVMDVPAAIQSSLMTVTDNYGPTTTLAVMMGLVLVAGCFTESVAVVLILAPILAPIAAKLGMDPVHWGIVFVFGTSIGFVTPPYGLNLFVVATVMNTPYGRLVREIIPLLIPLLLSWALVAAFPWLSLVFLEPG